MLITCSVFFQFSFVFLCVFFRSDCFDFEWKKWYYVCVLFSYFKRLTLFFFSFFFYLFILFYFFGNQNHSIYFTNTLRIHTIFPDISVLMGVKNKLFYLFFLHDHICCVCVFPGCVYVYLSLSLCLSVCLPACLSASLSVCVSLSHFLSVSLSRSCIPPHHTTLQSIALLIVLVLHYISLHYTTTIHLIQLCYTKFP